MLRANSTWFGSAQGYIKRLSPEARLLSGSLLLLSVIVSLPGQGGSIVFSLSVCVGFLLFCRLPAALLLRVMLPLTLLIGASFLVITLPAFISLPFGLSSGSSTTMAKQLELGSIFAKLLASSLISTAMIASVRYEELYGALSKLPLPATPLLILLQIVHQTSILFSETIRFYNAIQLRGNVQTLRGRKYISSKFPQTWLLRMFARTERVAMGMEMRRYGTVIPPRQQRDYHVFDRLCTLTTLSLFIFVLITLFIYHG